ncbi:hypothetical protein AB1N83_009269 [Pleurotus pulmonarius]
MRAKCDWRGRRSGVPGKKATGVQPTKGSRLIENGQATCVDSKLQMRLARNRDIKIAPIYLVATRGQQNLQGCSPIVYEDTPDLTSTRSKMSPNRDNRMQIRHCRGSAKWSHRHDDGKQGEAAIRRMHEEVSTLHRSCAHVHAPQSGRTSKRQNYTTGVESVRLPIDNALASLIYGQRGSPRRCQFPSRQLQPHVHA